jgi:hypothetical protein
VRICENTKVSQTVRNRHSGYATFKELTRSCPNQQLRSEDELESQTVPTGTGDLEGKSRHRGEIEGVMLKAAIFKGALASSNHTVTFFDKTGLYLASHEVSYMMHATYRDSFCAKRTLILSIAIILYCRLSELCSIVPNAYVQPVLRRSIRYRRLSVSQMDALPTGNWLQISLPQ